ncbi:hypothetical protein H3T41_07490 [Lactobacillus sp. W8089]|nr:hypothetical protein [Lactobacillus sp. W8089]
MRNRTVKKRLHYLVNKRLYNSNSVKLGFDTGFLLYPLAGALRITWRTL